uniref:Suppressor of G2 allele of SKP1 homolog n=1 Tax=Lepeophtheirus salmonis TaxID=72036 RepID=C1BUA6_LEPSM|nr:Suppressor of G2 allele of SKP1 homolog [Lepeophtheirus salmonis]
MDKERDKFYVQGNEAFVAEDYAKAIDFYTQSLSQRSSPDPDVLISRCHAFIKAEKYKEAKSDADLVISLNPCDVKARLRCGIACFHMGKYKEAREAFSEGHKIDKNDSGFKQWIVWCDDKIKKIEQNHAENEPTSSPPLPSDSKKIDENSHSSESPKSPPVDDTPKVTHGWYQTASSVVVEVRIKNLNGEDLKIEFRPTSFSIRARLPTGKDYFQEFNLFHPIISEESSYRITSNKVEINLKKAEGAHWPKLEGSGVDPIASITLSEEVKKIPHSYPTSSGKDWNKLEKELTKEAEDKLDGGEELDALFKKIYKDGNDDVRKAMNKSFMESGGTVLSTNWKDIQKEKVDVKPPEGVDFKSWKS